MRRQDREVTAIADLLAIIEACQVCRIGMQDAQGMYIVPVNFGYEYAAGRLTLFFHSAREGRKIEALSQNPAVCFEMDTGHEMIEGQTACDYGFRFKSIIGNGTASFIEDAEAKKRALDLLMRHQTGQAFDFDDRRVAGIAVVRIEVTAFTGKFHP